MPPGGPQGRSPEVEKGVGTAESKLNAFKKAGVKVVDFPTDIIPLVKADLGL